MGPEVPIRVAGPSDADAVTGLIAAFRDYLDRATPTEEGIGEAVSTLLADPGTEYLLAGEPEVGLAQVRYRPSVWTGSEDAWLEDVFVLEEARGDGVGRLLTEAAVRRAGQRGCGRIQLESNAANEAAIKLYESIGFRASHLPDRWGETPDICMTLEIDPAE
ncbi:MAG: GNAT family N-acetyltransferase [Solirubrobacterales bacterium]